MSLRAIPAPVPQPVVNRRQILPPIAQPFRLFIWPRWDNPHDLVLALEHYATLLANRSDTALIVYADPGLDGSHKHCARKLAEALQTKAVYRRLHTVLVTTPFNEALVQELKQAVTVTAVIPSIMVKHHAQLYQQIGAPLLFSHGELSATLRTWDALARGESLEAGPPVCPLPPEISLSMPKSGELLGGWLSRTHVSPPRLPEQPRLAILVPYRDRASHLAQLATYMTNYLKHIEYDLYVIEQDNDKPFNRAKLLNIGFDQVAPAYDYVAFHDVDLFPVISDYRYTPTPTHLAARVGPGYKLFYDSCIGGVMLMTPEVFRKINGFSNEYWGWGGEDDDLYVRLAHVNAQIHRRDGLYDTLPHQSNAYVQAEIYQNNLDRLKQTVEKTIDPKTDGLSSLTYTIRSAHRSATYTRLAVDI
jgi:hypothetical protein